MTRLIPAAKTALALASMLIPASRAVGQPNDGAQQPSVPSVPSVVLSRAVGQSNDGAQPEKPESPISISVSFSVEQFDPARPAGVVVCTVHNHSQETIEVPDRYDGHKIALVGRGKGHRFACRLWDRSRDQEEPKMLKVAPGTKKTVFEFSLGKILADRRHLIRDDFEAGRRVLVWDWRAHPMAPPSPIHRGRDGGFVDQATFWGELRLGTGVIRSDKVVLKVKAPD
jgi:hypothetical protein